MAGRERHSLLSRLWARVRGTRAKCVDNKFSDAGVERRSKDPWLAEMQRLLHADRLDLVQSAARERMARQPDDADGYYVLGLASRAQGNADAALENFRNAVRARHDHADAHLQIGQIRAESGDLEDAADHFQLAIAFDSVCAGAHIGLARIAREDGRVEECIAQLDRLISLVPDCAPAYFELGLARNRQGDTAGAEAAYSHAVRVDAGHVESLVNLALIHLMQLGNPGRAETLLRRAVALQPDMIEAQANLGLAIQEQQRFEDALAHYENLIRTSPEVVEYRWNRGMLRLARGDFASGWEDYELRKRRAGTAGSHRFSYAEWDGSPLPDKTLLVYAEQGLGDEIMFASCLPDALTRVSKCVVECDTRLAGLYRRSFPGARIAAVPRNGDRAWLESYAPIHAQCAVGSLPRLLRSRWSDFPPRRGYLLADPSLAADWRKRLARDGAGPLVGITWRGGTRKTRSELRSISVQDLAPMLAVRGPRFICLQHDATPAEAEFLARAGVECEPLSTGRDGLDDLSARISAMDLVIGVPCTALHVAGALGRPVWALLSSTPEWRYLWSGERMPWYPSMRLWRQSRSGDWNDVITRVSESLASGELVRQ